MTDAIEQPPMKKGLSGTALRVVTVVPLVPIIIWMMFAGPPWAWHAFILTAVAIAGYELMAMKVPSSGGLRAWGSASSVLFAYTIMFVCRDATERKRIGACAVLFLGAAMFWSGFKQAGSSMNIFARDFTDRTIGNFEITAGWLQSVNPMFIILMAPVMGALWVWLDKRNPSIPVKFAYGLVLLGAGFLVLAWGSTYVDPGKVGMQWLVATYFLHTVGE